MQLPLLLFVLNLFDAGLTLFWVEAGMAEEGNRLMRYLLEDGPGPFMVFKISIGLFAALCFYRWAHLPAARFGVRLALGVYTAICVIHVLVGLVASGAAQWLGF